MLSTNMHEHLNKQITLEFFSSNLYLQMSAWCEDQHYDNSAAFLRKHALEERQHMEKFYNYVLDAGAYPKLDAIAAPKTDFVSLKEIFEHALAHEIAITKAINELVDVALNEKDYTTFSFLQWFVQEQHEEQKVFNTILGKFNLIGEDTKSLYFIDKEVANLQVNTEMMPN